MVQGFKPGQRSLLKALLLVSLASLGLISGCGTTPVADPLVVEICDSDPDSLECFCDESPDSPSCSCLTSPNGDACFCASPQNENTLRCLCVRDPGNPACPENEASARSCPTNMEASELIKNSLVQSNLGNWDDAQFKVDCALIREPGNLRATQLLVQLQQGDRYFESRGLRGEHKYTVKPGETLGTIARDCLKNSDLFVALAKFNYIAVPGSLQVGSPIKIPGNEECGGNADQMLEEAINKEQEGDIEGAWKLVWKTYQVDKRDVVKTAYDRIRTTWANELVAQGLELVESDCTGSRKKWELAKRTDPSNKDAAFYLDQVPCD